MSLREHFGLMARYNAWMNVKVYDAAAKLDAQALAADRGAFFGSILGTLNHLAVGDITWLKRFATHPAGYAALDPVRRMPTPSSLDQQLSSDLGALRMLRRELDAAILGWAEALTDADLGHVLEYANMKGVVARRPFSGLVAHFFNHQTHHRGQVSTLLLQAGQDVGVTDLVMLIPDETAT